MAGSARSADRIGSLRVVTLDMTEVTDESAQDRLESGLLELVASIRAAADAQQRLAVDVRADDRCLDRTGVQGALLEAARGLVQSYTLESGASVPPVNLVVTSSEQHEDRRLTWEFLSDEEGGLCRGASLDLREERS